MPKTILIYFTILSFIQGQADYEITYSVSTNLSLSWMIDGEYKLYFNQQTGYYHKPSWPTATEFVDRGEEFTVQVVGDPEGIPVYTDLSKGIRYYKSLAYKGSTPLLIKDKIKDISWELIDSISQIGGFTVHLARGDFGGRTYLAWYTHDIPVPLGPFKLSGLPGLILTARSTDHRVEFRFNGLAHLAELPVVLPRPPIYGNLIDRDDMMDYMRNQLMKFEALSTSEYKITIEDPPVNTYIENDAWTYLTRIKQARGY